jgi:hypothetical protein
VSFRITTVSAFLAVDEKDEEGIIGMQVAGGSWVPFVMADETRLNQLRPHAENIARQSGRKIKLVRFSMREDLETISPQVPSGDRSH